MSAAGFLCQATAPRLPVCISAQTGVCLRHSIQRMSRPSDLPPNPREAKRRSVPLHWSFYPVTVALIAICGIVAVLSFVGADKSRISALFFAEPATSARYETAAAEVLKDIDGLDATLTPEDQEKYLALIEDRLRRDNFANIARG